MPARQDQTVTEGGQPLQRAAGVNVVRCEPHAVLIEIGSGSYRFSVR